MPSCHAKPEIDYESAPADRSVDRAKEDEVEDEVDGRASRDPENAVQRECQDLNRFLQSETRETEPAWHPVPQESVGQEYQQDAEQRPAHGAPDTLQKRRHRQAAEDDIQGEDGVDAFHAPREPVRVKQVIGPSAGHAEN